MAGVIQAAARDVGEVAAGGGIRARPDHLVLQQGDGTLERNPVLADRRVEQADALVLGLP